MFAEIQHTRPRHPVPFIGRIAAAAAQRDFVPHFGRRQHANFLPHLPDAQTKIEVFVIHEKAFVEATGFLQDVPRQHQSAGRYKLSFDDGRLLDGRPLPLIHCATRILLCFQQPGIDHSSH